MSHMSHTSILVSSPGFLQRRKRVWNMKPFQQKSTNLRFRLHSAEVHGRCGCFPHECGQTPRLALLNQLSELLELSVHEQAVQFPPFKLMVMLIQMLQTSPGCPCSAYCCIFGSQITVFCNLSVKLHNVTNM